MRTIKEAMGSMCGAMISPDHPARSWLAGHAGPTITRYMVGIDGMAAHERRSGRMSQTKEVAVKQGCETKVSDP